MKEWDFLFHETIIKANTKTYTLSKSFRSCLLCGGNGKIEDLKTGEIHGYMMVLCML